jgi:thiosulfate/3-mercaptopyruvate sulfurtransferase
MPVDLVVTPQWLEEHLADEKVRVVDIRGHVMTSKVGPGVEHADYRGVREEYLAGHIPGAVYIDWTTDITDPDDPVPAQIAPPDRFAAAMASRGIGDQTHVVAVDQTGGQFATRLWWALRYYGHDQVSVLDRGWNAWVDERRPVETGAVAATQAVFTPRPRPELRATAEQVAAILGQRDFTGKIVDAPEYC